MTAIRARRRKLTIAGFAGGVLAVVAIAGLGYAGIDNLADSRAGRRVSADTPDAPLTVLPVTPTALVGTADDDGWLTSVVVLALDPAGVGGSIVSLSPSADAASGNIDSLAPLNGVYVVDGPAELLGATEGLTSMAFDVAEIVDAERFADLVMPLGELTVELPTELRDASSAEQYDAGVVRLTPAEAADAVLSRDPEIDDWLLDPARAAVWAAVADAVGEGVGANDFPDGITSIPSSLDEFVARLFAGRVEHRSFGYKEIAATRVNEQLGEQYVEAYAEYDDTAITVVAHDRAELAMVLAAIAPGRMGAPFEGPTARVLSSFTSEQLEPLGQNNADVARQAINRLLFAKVNVVSFGQVDEAPELTLVEVADASLLDTYQQAFGTLFGEAEVVVAESVIEGIDVQITLGRAYLDTVEPAE